MRILEGLEIFIPTPDLENNALAILWGGAKSSLPRRDCLYFRLDVDNPQEELPLKSSDKSILVDCD
jgi:hypothetical protein